MDSLTPEEYTAACRQAIESLTTLAEYTEGGEKELAGWEAPWFFVVALAYHSAVGPEETSGGSNFRVDGTLY